MVSLPEDSFETASFLSSSISKTRSIDFCRFCAWDKAVLAKDEKLVVSNQLMSVFCNKKNLTYYRDHKKIEKLKKEVKNTQSTSRLLPPSCLLVTSSRFLPQTNLVPRVLSLVLLLEVEKGPWELGWPQTGTEWCIVGRRILTWWTKLLPP